MATTTDQPTAKAPAAQNRQDTRRGDPYRYLLLLRCGFLNVAAGALFVAAWGSGLVDRAIDADSTRLVLVIGAVFLAGLMMALWYVYETSREINLARQFDPAMPSFAASYVRQIAGKDAQSRQILASSLRLKLSQRITIVRHVGNSLVVLGLIGTVVGFIIALSGVDPETVAEAEKVSVMVATLIQGMSTALVTTLVGAVLNIWLMANYQLLASGTANLITIIVELGEDRAGA